MAAPFPTRRLEAPPRPPLRPPAALREAVLWALTALLVVAAVALWCWLSLVPR